MEKRIVIVQCRLSSSRLPQKALKKLGDKTLLDWVLQSMHKIPCERYFVAADFDSYNVIKPICEKNDFECFAGSLNDVLQRFVDLLNTVNCETVIRATADNPFLFYEAALDSVELFEDKNKTEKKCDYLTFSGLPHGSGVEIFSASSLKKAILNTKSDYDHEHVGPALYNHKNLFTCEFVPAPKKYNFPQLRTTVDTYTDYLRAVLIEDFLKNQKKQEPFSYKDIIDACLSDYVKNPVILFPSVKKGQGTGHLRRTLKLAEKKHWFVYIPENTNYEKLNEIPQILDEYFQNDFKEKFVISQFPDSTFNATVITDNFKLSNDDIKLFSQNGITKLVSIDDDSPYNSFCDYTVDIIPPLSINKKQNFWAPSFIEKPKNVKNPQKMNFSFNSFKTDDFTKFFNILVCFGGEDPANFSLFAAKILKKLFKNSKITVICSKKLENSKKYANCNSKKNQDKDITILPQVKNLKEELYNFDIVATHYGLTAFESFYAGCKVILFSTTKLHEKLSKKYGFCYIKYGKLNEKKVKNAILKNKNEKKISDFLTENEQNNVLAKNPETFFEKIQNGRKYLCPICKKNQKNPDKVVSRNFFRTYRRCQNCSIVYISYSVDEKKTYEKSYFFEDYKKQYGKTYQEDFDSIKQQGLRRIDNIKKIDKKIQTKNLLDIGCAYGPFLSATSENQINPYGTDISDDAVNYVQNILRFPAITADFPQFDSQNAFGISQFDIVTMWYVIEHFEDLDNALKQVSKILKSGGIFAFSTPCGQGISCKTNKDDFYKKSPSDHFTVWEKTNAAKILLKYGFKVVKTVSTGHHPERFLYIQKRGAKSDSFRWKFVEKISIMKKLGDTMEIYCKKI